MVKNPFEAYKEQGILTANPVELVIMLFDGCKKNMMLARRAIEHKNDPAAAHNYLIKAQNIIGELLNALDMSFSISKDLMSLYEFLLSSLVEINTTKNAEALEPLIEIVESLRDTWREVADMQKGNFYMKEEE